MKPTTDASEAQSTVAYRRQALFHEYQQTICQRTDRLFAVLMTVQWLAGIIAAVWISPRAWRGLDSQVHLHVWAAIFLGGAISAFPILLAQTRPGACSTRQVIAVGQMLMSSLLIHLTGGRIETHFHVFGSLAFLACYREWPVLVSATVVVAADHFLRGVFWPQSAFGVLAASPWRWVEHAGWVVFADVFLIKSCLQSTKEMWSIAERQACLEIQEQQLQARTAELATLNATLQVEITERKEAERLKDELVSTVSHELRTPLTSLRGYAELMLNREYPREKQHQFLTIIYKESIRLTALISDFLDLQRMDSGREVYHFLPLAVPTLLDDLLPLFAHDAETHPLTLDVPAGLPLVYGDATRLSQVLINLVSNAIKYSPHGGAILLRASLENSFVRLSVSDHGIGIPQDMLPQLFSRFFRVDNGETRKIGGTGLGLALVKEIVEVHGGRVMVESQMEHGSSFSFTIPLFEERPATTSTTVLVKEETHPETLL